MLKSYKDLIVYQKAYEVSLEVHKMTLRFPSFENYELGAQLRRATKSIPMNIAEGFGRNNSLADFKRFLVMALGSCDEVRVILDYCKDLDYINTEQSDIFASKYEEVGRMLTKMIKDWKK